MCDTVQLKAQLKVLRSAVKSVRIRLALGNLRAAGKPLGRPRGKPLNRALALNLRRRGYSYRSISRALSLEAGRYVSKDSVWVSLRSGTGSIQQGG